MPQRNWWRRLCHDFLSRSRRTARRTGRVHPRFDYLESRLAPANLSNVVPIISNSTPVEGEWVSVSVQFDTDALITGEGSGDSYDIEFRLNGNVFVFNNLTLGYDQGTTTQTFNLTPGFWSLRPGTNTLEVILNPNGDLTETNSGDNSGTLNITPSAPTTLPQRLILPFAEEQANFLSIVNYADTLPTSTAMDFRGGGFVSNNNPGFEIRGGTATQMDSGLLMYAAAAGTVSAFSDVSPFGRAVTIDLGNGWTMIQAGLHSDGATVRVGDTVAQGQILGYLGNNFGNTETRVRVELRYNNITVDPFQNIAAYFADPVPVYQGDQASRSKASGISNDNADLAVGPSSKTVFDMAESDDVWFWTRISHLDPGDQLVTRWYRPDGTQHSQATFTASILERNGFYTWTLAPSAWKSQLGKWEVAVTLAGQELARQSFQVVNTGAVPEILVRDSVGNLLPSGRTNSILYPTVSQFGAAADETFSIQNHSSAPLNITNIEVPPGFSLVGAIPTVVNGNSSATFTVRLNSSVEGYKFGAVRILCDDADEGVYTFNIRGRVTGSAAAAAPDIFLAGDALVYQVGSPAILINPLALVNDTAPNDFDGGQIIIEFASGGQPGDRLAIRNAGGVPGPGEVSLSGSNVLYEGNVVGSFTGGNSTVPLTITLNSSADLAAVQAIVRAALYSNVDYFSTAPRYIRFTVIDGSGNVSNYPYQVIVTDVKAQLPGVVTGVPFSSAVVVHNPANSVRSVAAGDINGDGDIDLVAASFGSDLIAWYDRNAAGNYTRRTISNAADGAHSVTLADFDGDGDLDVASASYLDNKIAWYRNNGGTTPTFNLLTISTTADGATSVFAADVDGDGDMDIVAASYLNDTIAWYQNDGAAAPAFTLITISTTADGARSVFAADLDGDGDMDIVSASYLDNKIAWYQNDGNQNFTLRTISLTALGATSVFVADVDGDGHLDILSASAGDDKIAWYRNNGAANPVFTLYTVSLGADGASGVFAADIDGDGDMDIASSSRLDDSIKWYENNGLQNFTERVITNTADGAFAVIAVDADRDGDMDIVAASATDNTVAWYRNETIHRSALLNTTASIGSSVDGAIFVTTADVDRDGDMDVISASLHDDKIVWYRNDGNGSFSPRVVSTTANGATSVAAVDLDGDGDIDLLSTSFYDNKLAWYRNDGAQNFTLVTITAISAETAGAISVVAADVDGDGDMDIVVGSFEDDEVSWYENDGAANPTFTRRTITTTADGVRMVIAVDLDRDGDMDIVSASYNDNKIAWYENDGTQNFTRRTITTAAFGAMSVAAADMDRDGDIDLVITAAGDNTVQFLRNSNMTFTSFIIGTPSNPRSAVLADMDGDGDLDIVVASVNDNTVAWYENEGTSNPAFATQHIVSNSVLGAISVAAADLDGDGDMDIVSAAYFGDAIAWHENRGGQFRLTTTSTAPVGISQGQMDDVLKIVMTHNGRLNDHDAELTSLSLLFDDGANPLSSAAANALIENVFIYRDTGGVGSGTFQAGTDTLVATVSDLDLLLGVQRITFADGDPNVRVPFASGPVTFFVVVELTADATQQLPSEFRITHLTTSTSTAEDRDADLPLRLEFVANFTSPLVDALEVPAITSADNVTFTVDVLDTFTVTATGGPPPTFTLGGDALPGGVSFVDNLDGTATLSGTPTGLVAGVYNLTITASNGVNPDDVQNFTLTVDPGAVAQVSFIQQPTNTAAGATISPSVTVQLEDQYGNDISQSGVDINLALILGTGPLNGTLTRQTNAGGLATFDNLSLNLTGTKQLQATSTGLASEDSNTFVIGAAAATQLVFVQQPTDAVAGVAISPSVTVQLLDQFGNLANQAGVDITLSLLTGSGTLSGTVTRATNASGLATFNDLSINLVGTKSLQATSSGLTSATSNNFVISAAPASQVVFVQQPTDTTAGNNISPAVTVQVQDQFGNNVSQSGTSVTVSLNSGTGPLQGSLTQTTNASGLATFNDLRIDVIGAKTLQAVSSGLNSGNSSSFTINAAAATNLVFIQQPTDTAAGSTIPNITVQIRDAFGNNASQSGTGIGISLISGNGTLAGTTTQLTDANGLATFSGLSINLAGLKTLQVASTGLGTTDSNQFTINPGAATEVVFVQQPTNTVAGDNIAPVVTVRLRDQFGNNVTQSGVTVNMALLTGTGTLLGTTAQDTVGGIATFSDLHINIAGTKSLQASSTLLTSATSNTFDITAAAASQLGFAQQPTNTVAGNVISPAVTVQVQDQFGNAVNQSGTTVALTLGGTGTLLGTTSVATNASGVATFNDLQINTAGTKSLQADSGGLTSATSNNFDITAAAASKVVFVQQPTDTDIFVAISPAVTVQLRDQFDNDVAQSGTSVDMVLSSGTGTLGGTTTQTTNASGLATFGNLSIDAGGTKSQRADSGGLTSATSNSFFINIPPTQVDFVAQPTDTTAGNIIAPVTVQLKDHADANVALADVSITVSLFSGSGTLLGTLTQLTDASGLATFNDLQINVAGTGKVLRATSGGLTADDSTSFTINAAAATQVVFVQQPTDAIAGNVIAPDVTVQLRDQFGNNVTQNGVNVTVTLETGAGPLMGTTTQATVNGVATFDDLKFEAAGAKTLRASAGLTDATSSSFTISPDGASQLAFVQQPTNTSTGTTIAPPVTVQLRDQFGNDVAQGSTSVTVALNSGTGTLLGTLTQDTNGSGTATFNDLSIVETGSKTLNAASGALTGATSASFHISAPATSVVFIQQPTDTMAGNTIAPVTVQLRDQFGTDVMQANISVMVSLVSGTGTLLGTTTQLTDVNGLATFSNLQINTAGGGKNLRADSAGLTGVVSTSFAITAAAANKVAFVQQPTSTTAGANITPAVTVQLRDQFDNNVTQAGVDVIMSLSAGSGTLLGTLTQSTNGFGVATFNNLHIHVAGAGKMLQASSTGLASAGSNAFTIGAAAATQLVFAQQPPLNALAGAFLAPAVVVQLQDQFGNNANQAGVTVNLGLVGSGTLSGTTSQVTSAAGTATFGNLSVNLQGAKSLQATSGGLTGATSTGFNINAVADRVEFTLQPTGTTAGVVMPPVTVQLKDQFGNLINQANVAVNLAMIAGDGTLIGTLTQLTDAVGVATFTDLRIHTAGIKTLRASSAGLLFAHSADFNITAAAAQKLAFLNQPRNVRVGTAMPPVIVQLQDEFGNAVAQGGGTVKITLISGGQRRIYTTRTNSAGQAVFRNLVPMRRGNGRLVAQSAGLLTAVSNRFQVLLNPNFPWL